MIAINLLPVKQLKKRYEIRNEVALYATILIGLVLIMSGITLSTLHTISTLKKENAVLSRKKASYQPILNQIDKLKKDKAKKEKKLEVIKQLKTGSLSMVRILDELARITPVGRLWFNNLSITKGQVKVLGIALDNATIAQFMNRINSSRFFTGAELARTNMVRVAQANLKSFSLTIGIKQPSTDSDQKGKNKGRK